jgi:hypothetical protein
VTRQALAVATLLATGVSATVAGCGGGGSDSTTGTPSSITATSSPRYRADPSGFLGRRAPVNVLVANRHLQVALADSGRSAVGPRKEVAPEGKVWVSSPLLYSRPLSTRDRPSVVMYLRKADNAGACTRGRPAFVGWCRTATVVVPKTSRVTGWALTKATVAPQSVAVFLCPTQRMKFARAFSTAAERATGCAQMNVAASLRTG